MTTGDIVYVVRVTFPAGFSIDQARSRLEHLLDHASSGYVGAIKTAVIWMTADEAMRLPVQMSQAVPRTTGRENK